MGDYYYPGYMNDKEEADKARRKFFKKIKGLFKKKKVGGKGGVEKKKK